MLCQTPVIFFIFRRPLLTKQVFEAIRAARPSKLLVVADGPRDTEDVIACKQARSITEEIDWKCEVSRNYSEVNLGCRERVSSGLTWAFSQVEEAIILEDDCLPNPSFFCFCQSLLAYYRDDERIWTISGNNFQDGIRRSSSSYFFSKYPFIWGWATWRRAWQNYDTHLEKWSENMLRKVVQSVCEDPDEQEFRFKRFHDVVSGEIDAWDPKWSFTCWANNALCAIPETNLVSNIGFGSQATHTTNRKFPYANLKAGELKEICHPAHIFRDIAADQYFYDNFFGGYSRKESRTLKFKVKNKMKKYLSLR